MDLQRRRFAEAGSGATSAVALLAFSPSPAFDAIFRSLGAETVRLDPLRKPAVGEIAEAAQQLQRPDVIVLPNHKDLLMAAEQAAALSRRTTLHVLRVRSVPQGIAAAVAFDPTLPVGECLARMADAAKAVRTVEVTFATQARRMRGVNVRPDDAIALVDDELVAAAQDPLEALIAGLEAAGAAQAELVTVYVGDGIPDGTLAELGRRVRERFPNAAVELHTTGQPLYPFIASVE
jgi:dihydroxyacetone kinase-like predicted kinase